MVNSLEALLPSNVRADMAAGQPASRKEAHDYKIDHLWTWHPLGNEELWIGGGCAGKRRREGVRGKPQATCGILIARKRLDEMVLLDWVPSEYWQPILREAESPRELFLHGGDDRGAFRRKLSYAWGRLVVEEKERKRKRLGQSEPTYWPP